jgi:hypothetical protein
MRIELRDLAISRYVSAQQRLRRPHTTGSSVIRATCSFATRANRTWRPSGAGN